MQQQLLNKNIKNIIWKINNCKRKCKKQLNKLNNLNNKKIVQIDKLNNKIKKLNNTQKIQLMKEK